VLQVSTGRIVLQDDQYAAGFDPLRNLRAIFRLHIMRVRVLNGMSGETMM